MGISHIFSSPYARLMRLHQPAGIWLLLAPCLWALFLAAREAPISTLHMLSLLVRFALGAVMMRGAGCIVNDLLDRSFDREVARTRNRPLASGVLTVRQALRLLVLLLLLSAMIALTLPGRALLLCAASLVPVALYPLMKRITWWPQVFLGITFNLGVLIAWVAVARELSLAAWLFYGAGIAWTLAYDTLYALQDREDDARIGVKSTALRLGRHVRPFILACYGVAAVLLLAAGAAASHFPLCYGIAVFLVFASIGYRLALLPLDVPAECHALFRLNGAGGLIIAAGAALDWAVSLP